MIKSKFILDILELLLDGPTVELSMLRKQIPFINEEEREYTGFGVFVGFTYDSEKIKDYLIENSSIHVYDGVYINSEELNEDGAEGILHLKDGLINYLEIWCFSGIYPEKDLSTYILTQEWEGAPGEKRSS